MIKWLNETWANSNDYVFGDIIYVMILHTLTSMAYGKRSTFPWTKERDTVCMLNNIWHEKSHRFMSYTICVSVIETWKEIKYVQWINEYNFTPLSDLQKTVVSGLSFIMHTSRITLAQYVPTNYLIKINRYHM